MQIDTRMALENSAQIVEEIQDIDVEPLRAEGVGIQAQGANGVRTRALGLMLHRVFPMGHTTTATIQNES